VNVKLTLADSLRAKLNVVPTGAPPALLMCGRPLPRRHRLADWPRPLTAGLAIAPPGCAVSSVLGDPPVVVVVVVGAAYVY
jgi:hypothetical protein